MDIGASTRVFALLGNPVSHSLSPAMHNAAFRALGIDAVYLALRCAAEEVTPLIRVLAANGGGGNVTVPHKEIAARAVSHDGGPPLATCNTFWSEDGAAHGTETDSIGIAAAWQRLGAPEGGWLIAGTGGSARAAVLAALRVGAPVAVQSRSPERREAFLHWAAGAGARIGAPEEARFAINATPLGLQERDPLPLPIESFGAVTAVLDLVYRPNETPWVRAARQSGRRAADGRDVLLEQGAAAFERWFPGVVAPREVMHAALRAALG
jgi:shikimate dehydrogenase